ncbi:unnamed protein product [Clonostachys rosea f. rosea IK726]|uniref:Major facilitator superfamily (MFS) profile domain-containing protein n=2 Tax=Bionectria ochroleuca TaxID=29856 RepID=A0A0B7K884_BIOOC|nr:unnamed protein product [Clonostachys rosea f. rosea IK726]
MADEEGRLPLSYPNPSLGQMATPAGGSESSHTTKSARLGPKHPVQGARQVVLVISLLLGLLFSTLDTSIIATSLITISHEMQDFSNAPWIVLAYLLTYMGFAVWQSKLSDIYGRRNMIVISWVIFTGFSLGCATAKDMISLIVCRAFQGVGASGLYSLAQIGLVEVGPVHRPSLVGAMIGATLAVAFVLGPIIGGAVSHSSDWRWLFNMNIPFGLVAILAISNLWPSEQVSSIFSWDTFSKIDFLGGGTLLLGSGLLVFAIQQAGSQTFAWGSPAIISTLVISGLSWIGFVIWEIRLQLTPSQRIEPIFPIKLMLHRVYSVGLLVTLLTGFPYIALCILIPERFQIINGENVLMAGVHILPLLGACAAGSFLGGAISSTRNNTSPTLVLASCLQLLGTGLMMLVSSPDFSPESQYAFQAIFGLGVGLSFSAATIMTNIMASEDHERASAQGAVAQARVLGGCIGLSVSTVIFNGYANRHLSHLSEEQLQALHRSPLTGLQILNESDRELTRKAYGEAFSEQIKMMMLICAAMVVVSLLTLERKPAPLERLTTYTKDHDQSPRGSDSVTELNDLPSVRQSI